MATCHDKNLKCTILAAGGLALFGARVKAIRKLYTMATLVPLE